MEPQLFQQILNLANSYSTKMNSQISNRLQEMKKDDTSHYLIYRILGISNQEGERIDTYQNTGRFLYKYAGDFLQEATIACFKAKDCQVRDKFRISNTISPRPKTFEIDCLIGNLACEIKWRDATTDGDHIIKENNRLQAIINAGFIPVCIMFFMPNRKQAIQIQDTLKNLYQGVGGQYYAGDSAWEFVQNTTGYDLKNILTSLAQMRTEGDSNDSH